MIHNPKDLRVRKTEQNLKNSLLELLQEKEMKAITVKDICKRAQCSRNAFYNHYTYKEDLYEQIEEECFSTIRYAFRPNATELKNIDTAALEFSVSNIISEFEKASNTLLVLVRSDNGMFTKKVTDEIFDELVLSTKKMTQAQLLEEDFLGLRYIASAIAGFTLYWLKSSKLSAEEAKKILLEMHLAPMRATTNLILSRNKK